MYRLLYLGGKARHYNIAYVWTAVEVNLAVISCSMPALRPLFSRLLPRLFGSTNSGNNNRSGGAHGDSTIGGASGTLTYGGSGASRSHQRESHAMNYMFKDLNLHPARKQAHTEIRGVSPDGSEEEIMTYNGILRTTNVNVRYEDAKRSDGGSTTNGDGGSNISSDVPQTNA